MVAPKPNQLVPVALLQALAHPAVVVAMTMMQEVVPHYLALVPAQKNSAVAVLVHQYPLSCLVVAAWMRHSDQLR